MKHNQFVLSLIFLVLFTLLSCERKSGRRPPQQSNRTNSLTKSQHATLDSKRPTIVKMAKRGGVFYIPCKINGVDMEFIFDTGASIISISTIEVLFLLKHNKLSEDDILGTSYFSDATGTISEGTLINLRKVQIGSRTLYDVRASVVNNLEAPLLLGQSALQQFGKVTIDYNNDQLIFE
jgi:aspartyl protease family protein